MDLNVWVYIRGGSTLGTWRIRKAGLAGSASTEREMATNVGEGRKYLATEGGQGSARGRIRQDSHKFIKPATFHVVDTVTKKTFVTDSMVIIVTQPVIYLQ